MTTRKIESESAATSTIAAERPAAHTPALTRRLIVLAIFGAGAAWLAGPAGRLLVVGLLLLFGPGYLVERALVPPLPATPFLRPALWLGLSLSVVALIYEWATALGLALSTPVLALLAAACGLGVTWQAWRQTADETRRQGDKETRSDRSFVSLSPCLPFSLSTAALLAILALTLGMRLYQIRGLALPNWVDSIHHALMIRIAAERGQAPIALRPYMPVDQLPYHWGYHVFVATAMRLSGLTLPETILWTGQALNAIQGLAAAGLAAFLWRRPLAGVVAALVVGLLSIFPAYYVSWGRYTQLTGLLLLPPLIAVWLALLRAPTSCHMSAFRRLAIVLALLLAGLSLFHFIVLTFALCFLAVSGIAWALGAHRASLRSRLLPAAGSAALALILAGPWLWLLAARALLRSSVGQAQPLLGSGSYYALDQKLLWAGHNGLLIALALLAALWGVRRRSRPAAMQVMWVAALFLLANPWLALYVLPLVGVALSAWGLARRRWLRALCGAALLLLNPAVVGGLPYLGLVTTESVVISLFLPIGVLLGGGACMLAGWLERRTTKDKRPLRLRSGQAATNESPRPSGRWSLPALPLDILGNRAVEGAIGRWSMARTAGLVVLAGLALWGAWSSRDIVNPATVLATPGDVEAIAWVAEHTPADARFLINAAPWLDTGRGADGGWWLLPLAGRWTSTPAVLYDYGARDYVRETRARTQLVIGFRAGQEQAIYDMIDRDRITYVYLGPRSQPLTPAAFPASAGFEKIYEQGGVTIFAVHRP